MSQIALLQINPTVGDLRGNKQRLESMISLAHAKGALATVSPELAIAGYPPRDLLLDSEFVEEAYTQACALRAQVPSLIGTPLPATSAKRKPTNGVVRVGPHHERQHERMLNKIVAHKQLLPTYDVFDEARYFESDHRSAFVRSFGTLNVGVTVCEDAWQAAGLTPSEYQADPIESIAEWGRQGVNLHATVNLSASPYHQQKISTRIHVARTAAAVLDHPFLLANQVGGNDDLLFDGRSLVAWPDGRVVIGPAWEEGILLVDLESPHACAWTAFESRMVTQSTSSLVVLEPDEWPSLINDIEDLVQAVVCGLGDYCQKSGISQIVLGLSGGIDSAVTACVAVAAVGASNVIGLSMPSRFSSQHSIDDALYTAQTLGMNYYSHPIDDLHQATESTMGSTLRDGHPVATENVQARLRALLVMGYANATASMAVTTGNKSEIAQGYCTLYGDMAGGYCPLGDVYKMQVYAMAEYFNQQAIQLGKQPPVNQSTLQKPPSAELAPNQFDQQTLPAYEVLDQILKHHIEGSLNAADIVQLGFDEPLVIDVLTRLERNEHKRWQMAPAPRVSSRAFGQGWRRPLASKHDWRTP